MVTSTAFGLEASTLFGKTRRLILSLLFLNPGRSFYLRQVVNLTGAGLGPVQRDLTKLTKAGLVMRRKDGNQVYYRANLKSPIYNELKSIFIKTGGLTDQIKIALNEISDSIKVAFIYGSFAKGTHRWSSDLDILVVGDVALIDVIKALRPSREIIMRELNPSVISEDDFREKVKTGHNFYSRIWNDPKIWLVGGQDDLTDMG